MYQPVIMNREPVLNTIAFMKDEQKWAPDDHAGKIPVDKFGFDMGAWAAEMPGFGTLCCIGGSMAIANGLDPYHATSVSMAGLMGVSEDLAHDLFHPAVREDTDRLVHWHITREDAVGILEGLIEGAIGYQSEAIDPFGYVKNAAVA